VHAPGNIASHGLTSAAQKVTTAIGASTATIGTLNIFAGSANIVARWKYIAIGSTITSSATNPINASSNAHKPHRTTRAGTS
jgi:hypothetical protein